MYEAYTSEETLAGTGLHNGDEMSGLAPAPWPPALLAGTLQHMATGQLCSLRTGLSFEIRLAHTQTGQQPGSSWLCSQELLFFLLSDALPFSFTFIPGSTWLLTFPTLFLFTLSSVICLSSAWHP